MAKPIIVTGVVLEDAPIQSSRHLNWYVYEAGDDVRGTC